MVIVRVKSDFDIKRRKHMREKKAILLLVLSACLFAIDFILKGDLGKVMFYIILLIGWILLLASIALQIKKKKREDD